MLLVYTSEEMSPTRLGPFYNLFNLNFIEYMLKYHSIYESPPRVVIVVQIAKLCSTCCHLRTDYAYLHRIDAGNIRKIIHNTGNAYVPSDVRYQTISSRTYCQLHRVVCISCCSKISDEDVPTSKSAAVIDL